MFKVNDLVVYPGHGLSRVVSIKKAKTSGIDKEFYVLQTMELQMTILVPVDDSDKVGVRAIVSKKAAKEFLDDLKEFRPTYSGEN